MLNSQKNLADNTSSWIFINFKRMLKLVGAGIFYTRTPLVLPDESFFPGHALSPYERASSTLTSVRKLLGMDAWPLKLLIQNHQLSSYSAPPVCVYMIPAETDSQNYQAFSNAREITININPALINNPQAMIVLFIYELINCLVENPELHYETDVPGNLTIQDIVAVTKGFGLFVANTSWLLQNDTLPQSVFITSAGSRKNTPNPFEISYCLALFSILKNIPHQQIEFYLKLNLHTFFKQSVVNISESPLLTELSFKSLTSNP